MRHYRFAEFIVAAAVAASCAAAARAQDARSGGSEAAQNVDDGFPELVAAYRMLHTGPRTSSLFELDPDDFDVAALANRRAELAQPAVRDALALQQLALSRPKLNVSQIYLIPYGDPIRLLLMKQSVAFADGKTSLAIDTLADALQIADALTASGEAGRVYGSGIKLRLIEATAKHLDQLSAYDCAKLLALMRREIGQPDAFVADLEAERKASLARIDIREAVKPVPQESDEMAEFDKTLPFYVTNEQRSAAAAYLAANPSAVSVIAQSIEQRVNAFYDDMEARYEAFPSVAPDALGPTRGIIETGMPTADRIAARVVLFATEPAGTEQFQIEKMMRVRAYERLLGVHVAIDAYRWEHDRLPDTLEPLKLRDLGQDPFSARAFVYRRIDDRTYTLKSVGYAKRDENANPIPGSKPVPISLVPDIERPGVP